MKKLSLTDIIFFSRKKKQALPFYRKPFVKFVSWILIAAILNLSQGCKHYFKVTKDVRPVSESLPEMQNKNKILILHFENYAWVFQNPEIKGDSIRGFAYKPYEPVIPNPVKTDKPNRYKNNISQLPVLNEVHIYTTEYSRIDSLSVAVPLSGIKKIEVYEKDKGATSGSYFLGALGITAGLAAVLTIIVALTKTSCPFIYMYDGEQSELVGEIYSGSVQPVLERHDFLKIPYKGNNPDLKLIIANEVKEIQHTNLMELWVFDHGKNTDVWVDKYGKCHSASSLTAPKNAVTFDGTDVTGLIEMKDSLYYTCNQITGELPLTDGIIMEFPNPKTSDKAKLIIRAKNSFVLDYMMGQFQNQFGDLYKKWQKKQQNAPAEQLKQWSVDQNIPLFLSVERNGVWEPVDYYNIAGPVAFKEDVLSIPLNGNESNPIKIKLEYGNFFWEVDYAGIDYSSDLELSYQIIPVNTAYDQEDNEVSKNLTNDDTKYYDQPNVGDYAVVSFKLPEQKTERRTIYLHSKGWYQILRNPSGTPDRDYLETFRNPGRFNQYVNEYIQSYTNK